MSNEMSPVFITGATGYMGTKLARMLISEGFEVTTLVRQQSIHKLPAGYKVVVADAFDHTTYQEKVPAGSIFIHLLGVAHPGPKKAAEFYSVDLASVKQSAEAAKKAGVHHFIYVSVAQVPTKIMAAYQDARKQGELCIAASGLKATIIRPWYVTGPEHYWPLFLQPVVKLLEWLPKTSEKAKALKLVSLKQMLATLKNAVTGKAPDSIRILEIRDIRKSE